MARRKFAGDAATPAEDNSGARLPGVTGTVWDGLGKDARQVTDLQDAAGNPIKNLTADARGMVPEFRGPDNDVFRLWVDFGPGRIAIEANDTPDKLQEHAKGTDPHGDRAYADQRLQGYAQLAGGNRAESSGVPWLQVEGDGTGARPVLQVTGKGNGNTAFQVSESGDATVKNLAVHGNVSADGDVRCGNLATQGTVTAKNVGTARVFSGPKPPENPAPGDVWVQYG
ncbi:hypothetical protein DR950_36075 [Kitasatospora xanthocidica]|uniref:Uncharacterized protein n=1 Tax=Kitasatospora xanthocidica TaxID=83382 RepID=A0A373A4U6_9ACTN|nr:hypothetical protein [Kitasatospora xanthocidica]RGD62455.1 hypothetical protein DR950_36075 [Kitasatospora xanthocidica]